MLDRPQTFFVGESLPKVLPHGRDVFCHHSAIDKAYDTQLARSNDIHGVESRLSFGLGSLNDLTAADARQFYRDERIFFFEEFD